MAKFTEEQMYFIKDTVDLELPTRQAVDLFDETWPGVLSLPRGRTLEIQREKIANDIRDFSEILSDYLLNKRTYISWTEEEVKHLMDNYVYKHTDRGLKQGNTLYSDIALELKKISGNERTAASIRSKLTGLRQNNGVALMKDMDMHRKDWKINPSLTLVPNQEYKGKEFFYELICDNGHRIKKSVSGMKDACQICSEVFVGGIPKNDFRPAIVYLIYVEELDSIKIGYATGKGQEAIVERFTKWEIPYKYEIVAYDQSTRTEAAEHEQWLLKNTIKHKTFHTSPGFTGWTEFRDKHILNQILPEYETVLDTAFKI